MQLFTVLLAALDVMIIAVLLYAAILLLRRTQSLFILRGFTTLFAVYLIAYYVGLTGTVRLFHFFFQFFVIIFVVVFQRELRRFFEGFDWASFRRFFLFDRTPAEERVLKAITESLAYCMERRVGALLVFPGAQTIESLTDSGFSLNGRISMPLILSIFDPSSPGHDGAVIVEDNLIKKFGVHLPLAENTRGLEEVGTRHRAALGLAERSDALVLIVSEEKGVVSVAQNGKLTACADIAEAEAKLRQHLETLPKAEGGHGLTATLAHDGKYRAFALLLAIILWSIFG